MQTQASSACCRGRARAAPQRIAPNYIHAAFGRSSWRPHHPQANPGLVRAAKSEAGTTSWPLTSTVETIGDCIQWGSCVSTRSKLKAALAEAVANIHSGMDRPFEPELAIVFASCSYGRELDKLALLLRAQCPTLKYIFGSTVSSSSTALLPVAVLDAVVLPWSAMPCSRLGTEGTLRIFNPMVVPHTPHHLVPCQHAAHELQAHMCVPCPSNHQMCADCSACTCLAAGVCCGW
jgi:hypothetical protein